MVADAGLIVPATLMVWLGSEASINQRLRLVGRVVPDRTVLTEVASIVVGGWHIDHADRLRAGATDKALPFKVMAPSTLGTFLPSFTFGHIRQPKSGDRRDDVPCLATRRWTGTAPMTIDLDSTICDVHSKGKQGAPYGYTKGGRLP